MIWIKDCTKGESSLAEGRNSYTSATESRKSQTADNSLDCSSSQSSTISLSKHLCKPAQMWQWEQLFPPLSVNRFISFSFHHQFTPSIQTLKALLMTSHHKWPALRSLLLIPGYLLQNWSFIWIYWQKTESKRIIEWDFVYVLYKLWGTHAAYPRLQ